jgi:hypothetical protein
LFDLYGFGMGEAMLMTIGETGERDSGTETETEQEREWRVRAMREV